MESKEFNKPTIEIVDINENDVIVTSLINGEDCNGFDNDDAEEWK